MESNDISDARAALSVIDAARAMAADRLFTPWWYHPILGFLAAGYFPAVTLGGVVGTVIAVPIFIGGLVVLVGSYKKRTGVWISGFTAGRASWWAFVLVIVIFAAALAAYALHATSGVVWPVWVAAVAMFLAVNILGRLFDTTLRATLRAKTAANETTS